MLTSLRRGATAAAAAANARRGAAGLTRGRQAAAWRHQQHQNQRQQSRGIVQFLPEGLLPSGSAARLKQLELAAAKSPNDAAKQAAFLRELSAKVSRPLL
jgi:hypothetical protein